MMLGFLTQPALRVCAAFLMVAGLFVWGYYLGSSHARQACEVERLRLEVEVKSAVEEAEKVENQRQKELQEARYEIEVNHDKHEDEIRDALQRNRDLADRLRRERSRGGGARVQADSGTACGTDEGDSSPGAFSGGVPAIPPEYAAACDRALAIAHAGQQWAKTVRGK